MGTTSSYIVGARCRQLLIVTVLSLCASHASAAAVRPLCDNGVDDDDDGAVDALKEHSPADDPEERLFDAPNVIRDFINGLNQFNPIESNWENQTHLAFDDATALQICRLAGFAEVAEKTATSFSSCSNNGTAFWRPEQENFETVPACEFNNHLRTLRCRGALVACNNGLDDDGDGAIDYGDDDGCASSNDLDEAPHDEGCDDPDDESETVPTSARSNSPPINDSERPQTSTNGSTAQPSGNIQGGCSALATLPPGLLPPGFFLWLFPAAFGGRKFFRLKRRSKN